TLARVLDRGLGREAGYVLPLARVAGAWVSAAWTFRRGHLFLVPGDSSIGLRLPLSSLDESVPPPSPWPEEPVVPPDPRRAEETAAQQKVAAEERARRRGLVYRTALCVEPRDGWLFVFLPPLPTA